MALLKTLSFPNGKTLLIWQLVESLPELEAMITLSESDLDRYSKMRLEKRKKEWICARILLYQYFNFYPHISYNSNGKPFLKEHSQRISISHCANFVAVSISDCNTALDIEISSPRVERIADRFLHDKEKAIVDGTDRLECLTVIWSAKETLYKLIDEPGLIFDQQLEVSPFKLSDEGNLNTYYHHNNHSELIQLRYLYTKQFILVYHL